MKFSFETIDLCAQASSPSEFDQVKTSSKKLNFRFRRSHKKRF